MALKDYQQAAMERFGEWYRILEEKKAAAEGAREELTIRVGQERADETFKHAEFQDYVEQAWEQVSGKPHVARHNGMGGSIPNVCFRVPTGGGKTLLAGCALERMKKQTGLVLWIVPTRAIFEQTMRLLRDKGSMLRQSLDRAGANRVIVMDKEYPVSRAAIDQSLCVMLLMKQGADNKREDFLKIRRDSAIYSSFFPSEEEDSGNRKLLSKNNLEAVQGTETPKHSLLNAIRIARPVIILDEAHKTRGISGEEIISYVSDMNPSLIIELSATPPDESNVLVNVSGDDLRQEEMIKMPINLTVMPANSSWKELLRAAVDDFEGISAAAGECPGRYIRPIMVVRAERVGAQQRGRGYIHAEDVREYIESVKSRDHEIALRTVEQDDLKGTDIMSEESRVRYIITKDALKEGWDCPFAYALVVLDKLKSSTGVTQLLGRILRQPGQRATGSEVLDSCYVYCRSEETSKIINYVKAGLEADGLADMASRIVVRGGAGQKAESRDMSVRDRLEPSYIPRVLHKDGGGWVELDYDRHILSEVDWGSITAPDMSGIAPEKGFVQGAAVDIGKVTRLDTESNTYIDRSVRISEWSQIISETIPNQWQASRVVIECIEGLRRDGHDDEGIYGMRRFLLGRLNDHVRSEIAGQAERVFRRKLESKKIRLDLEVDSFNYRMRERYTVSGDRLAILKDMRGKPVQRSLFDLLYEEQLDTDAEGGFAAHLDAASALKWWHGIAAKGKGEYYLRGWRQHRIWPDFVAVFGGKGRGRTLRIYEIKGTRLDNPGTEYKLRVQDALRGALDEWGVMKVNGGPMKGEFKILFENHVGEEGA